MPGILAITARNPRSTGLLVALSALLPFPSLAQAPAAAPQQIELSERAEIIADVSARVRATCVMDPQRQFEVKGIQEATSWWIAAREIVFHPNATLVFPSSVYSQSHELFLVADNIVLLDPSKPPTITWGKPGRSVPADRGQAASGPPGTGDGAAGTGGSPGTPGMPGEAGGDAPSITLIARSLNGAVSVDFSGGRGGTGGPGQKGGDGGAGARGGRARQARASGPFGITIWEPWCESGPGRGGPGGNGGPGGDGGIGGRGGRGGAVTIVSLKDALPTFTQAIRSDVGGGAGGDGGAFGLGGNAGAGGPEGELASFCNSAGRDGRPGAAGAPGSKGEKGDPGVTGRTYVSILTPEQFSQLFCF